MASNGQRRSGEPLGIAAIGALLRTPRLAAVAEISEAIGPATHNVAEYRALIEGLKLARDHGIERIRVYMDSELVVEQMSGRSGQGRHISGSCTRLRGSSRRSSRASASAGYQGR